MKLEVRKVVKAPLLTPAFTHQVLRAVQKHVTLPKTWQTLSVVVVGDATIRRLNLQYRQQSYIPDVLSFPYDDDGGEIVIGYAQAARQAAQKQVGLRRELAWLLVHGILHIAGYDHEISADAKVMRPLEQKILRYV